MTKPAFRKRVSGWTFYHAVQHLAAVGRTLFGEDQAKLKVWLKPLVKQLKNESAPIKVIRPTGGGAGANCRVVRPPKRCTREVNYFHEHEDRMDYRAGQATRRTHWQRPGGSHLPAEPVPRFKRPGTVLSQTRMTLLCLETFWRSNHAGTFYFPTPRTGKHCTKLRCAQA